MAVDKIRNEIGYQRENQTNIERAGNWLTDSGASQRKMASRLSPREVTWYSPPGNSIRKGLAMVGV